MITVNVLYFGAVREACKVAHEKISLESGTTVDGLVDQLQIDYPPLADFRKRVRMAVNESIAPASTMATRWRSYRRLPGAPMSTAGSPMSR